MASLLGTTERDTTLLVGGGAIAAEPHSLAAAEPATSNHPESECDGATAAGADEVAAADSTDSTGPTTSAGSAAAADAGGDATEPPAAAKKRPVRRGSNRRMSLKAVQEQQKNTKARKKDVLAKANGMLLSTPDFNAREEDDDGDVSHMTQSTPGKERRLKRRVTVSFSEEIEVADAFTPEQARGQQVKEMTRWATSLSKKLQQGGVRPRSPVAPNVAPAARGSFKGSPQMTPLGAGALFPPRERSVSAKLESLEALGASAVTYSAITRRPEAAAPGANATNQKVDEAHLQQFADGLSKFFTPTQVSCALAELQKTGLSASAETDLRAAEQVSTSPTAPPPPPPPPPPPQLIKTSHRHWSCCGFVCSRS
jgi:hypothetical protein